MVVLPLQPRSQSLKPLCRLTFWRRRFNLGLHSKVGAYVAGDEELAMEMEKFILQLEDETAPLQLHQELLGALGDDTELFIKLLWRLLIFHCMSVESSAL